MYIFLLILSIGLFYEFQLGAIDIYSIKYCLLSWKIRLEFMWYENCKIVLFFKIKNSFKELISYNVISWDFFRELIILISLIKRFWKRLIKKNFSKYITKRWWKWWFFIKITRPIMHFVAFKIFILVFKFLMFGWRAYWRITMFIELYLSICFVKHFMEVHVVMYDTDDEKERKKF